MEEIKQTKITVVKLSVCVVFLCVVFVCESESESVCVLPERDADIFSPN